MTDKARTVRHCTLEEFLTGTPLRYVGFDYKAHEATFDPGVGVRVARRGKLVGLAHVTTVEEAKRLFWNLTRRPAQGAAEKED